MRTIKGLGKRQVNLLNFVTKYNNWQSYNKRCQTTVATVKSMVRRGFIETNQFDQMRFIDS